MNDQHSTSNAPQFQDPTVNAALNSRWKYFKSLQGHLLAACFASSVLDDSPYFIEIDEFEYRHLIKEMQS